MRHSSKVRPASKVGKPSPDFPLFPHATGRWAKKIRQRLCYFGPIRGDENGQKALAKWLDQKDDLLAGRTPRPSGDGLTIRDLSNRFLSAKRALLDGGKLSPRTWADYFTTCKRLGEVFGLTRLVSDLRPEDFERLRAGLAKIRGPVQLGNEIQRVRTVFKYAYESDSVPNPVRFGGGFTKPKRKTIRLARDKRGDRVYTATEARAILDAASQPVRAMILLGLNAGFGNSDIGTLPLSALDLDAGWVNHTRPKTGIRRRCPLWPETIAALRDTLASRPAVKDDRHADLVFVTKYGHPWAKDTADNPVTKEFAKVLRKAKVASRGRGFYALRHCVETFGGECRDQVAVDALMGHSRDDMGSNYRHGVSDDRLRAVTDCVYQWLFGTEETK